MPENETCKNCNKAFLVTEVNGDSLGGWEKQEIKCPHCRYVRLQMSSGYFKVEKLKS